VIGLTVEQASEKVDKFLDEAALANVVRVRIIHGHGTGALPKRIRRVSYAHIRWLRVRNLRAKEHGGKAITVVDLKL